MAQIIKHRRGNLEGLSSATTRAGELLVVTGSSGLGTIANGDSLVFVGIDGSTATPVNKILQEETTTHTLMVFLSSILIIKNYTS